MKFVKMFCASIALLLAALFVSPHAEASVAASPVVTAKRGYFNDVTHAASDRGYTAAIKIECSDGRIKYLFLGESSPSKCGFHVARIIPGYNQAVECDNALPPYQGLYYLTPGNVPSGSSLKCYMQRPI